MKNTLFNNIQRSNLKKINFLNLNFRFFSSTKSKNVKPGMMKEVEELLAKSKAFEKDVKTTSDLLQEKQKLGLLKKIEWDRLEEFTQKYLPYLNAEDKQKALELFDQGQRLDMLIQDKMSKIDPSKMDSLEKIMKFVDISFNSKYKTFDKVFDLFKSSISKQASHGTIKNEEIDAFNILLAKRTQEKESFLNEKASSLNRLHERLNASKNISDSIEKPYPMVKDTSFSAMKDASTSSFFEDNTPNEAPLSEEFLNVLKDLLDLFT
jgi:hypothetical protein